MSFRVQEQHLSLHFVLPLYTYSDHLLFGFYAISYIILFSFTFSYLIIPPPCLTVLRWSYCPPAYLFCCLLPYLFHCIPFTFYIVSFKYLIFSLCYQPSKFWSSGSLSFHTFSLSVCIIFFFLGTELMTTWPTSNQCCDTHSSPAMTLTFLYIVGHIFTTASNHLY